MHYLGVSSLQKTFDKVWCVSFIHIQFTPRLLKLKKKNRKVNLSLIYLINLVFELVGGNSHEIIAYVFVR